MSTDKKQTFQARTVTNQGKLEIIGEFVYIEMDGARMEVGSVIELWDACKTQLLSIDEPTIFMEGTERRKDEVRIVNAYGLVRQQSRSSF